MSEKRIFKYEVPPVPGEFRLHSHRIDHFLGYQNQAEHGRLWVVVDMQTAIQRYDFALCATGTPLREGPLGVYLGSAQFMNGQLVWHLFVLSETRAAQPSPELRSMAGSSAG